MFDYIAGMMSALEVMNTKVERKLFKELIKLVFLVMTTV
ncbi:Uncharacterised protein [Clostridioides difficile]|nr:hypothetical protein ADOKEBJH_00126 [Clostridioides phage AR1086-1]SJP04240.1 Uncharacterised protein [Clostridioides difficile]SJP35668.1 Uncharacterised protein [Clostridioides difficile]SJQ19624.1 Uncharacterised protein [Clostridioides difficile]SJR17701.1 Uncharacterised protein [Clostridioides difficile]